MARRMLKRRDTIKGKARSGGIIGSHPPTRS